MESILRKHSSALINLAFAGLSTALLARGGLMIAMATTIKPAGRAPVENTPRPRGAMERPRQIIAFPQLAPEVAEPDPTTEPDIETPAVGGPLVPLAADVVGITWFDMAEWSLANLVVNNEHTVHSINRCIEEDEAARPCNKVAEGYTLVAIEKKLIRVRHEASGQLQELRLWETGPKPPVIASAATGPAAHSPGGTRGKGSAISKMMDEVKQSGPNQWEAPPGMRDQVLGRLAEVAMEGRWLPHFENGKIAGFKLAQTVPNSAFEKIGLKPGDIIKSVNGYDISSPDKILDVFTRLRDARDINVDLVRGDKGPKTSLKYTIN